MEKIGGYLTDHSRVNWETAQCFSGQCHFMEKCYFIISLIWDKRLPLLSWNPELPKLLWPCPSKDLWPKEYHFLAEYSGHSWSAKYPQHGNVNEHCRSTFLAQNSGPFVTGKAVTCTLAHRLWTVTVLLENLRGRAQTNRGKQQSLAADCSFVFPADVRAKRDHSQPSSATAAIPDLPLAHNSLLLKPMRGKPKWEVSTY